LITGDSFGYLELFELDMRMATVVAMTNLDLLVITINDIKQLAIWESEYKT